MHIHVYCHAYGGKTIRLKNVFTIRSVLFRNLPRHLVYGWNRIYASGRLPSETRRVYNIVCVLLLKLHFSNGYDNTIVRGDGLSTAVVTRLYILNSWDEFVFGSEHSCSPISIKWIINNDGAGNWSTETRTLGDVQMNKYCPQKYEQSET